MFEHETICLIYLLNCCFESVHVCKPVTSKEGNSEVYIICLNYTGTEKNKPWLRKLRQFYGSDKFSSHCLFPLISIPESFIKQQLQCSELFKCYQENVLERNIMHYVIDFSSGPDKYRAIRQNVCDMFMKNCQLKPLESEADEIVGKSKLANIKPLQLDNRYEEGTFTDRITSDLLPLQDKLSKLLKRISNIELHKVNQAAVKLPSSLPPVKVVKGKPVNVIKSSKFCPGQVIQFRLRMNNLIDLAKVEKAQTGINFSKTISLNLKASITRKNPNALRQDCVQFNFGESLWLEAFAGNYNKCERIAVSSIIRALDDTWRDCNFIIEGFPMLTQYSVGFIFILGHLFKEVHVIWPDERNVCHGVLFCGFKSRNPLWNNIMSELASESDESNDDVHSSVNSIIPIYHLVEDNHFYETVVSYNTNTLRHQLVRDGKLIEASISA